MVDQMEEETFKAVPGFDDKLYVSNVGRVWQYNTQRRRWTDPKVPTILRHGYPTTCYGQKIYRVHKLVALAFLGPPPTPKHTVDHIAKYGGDWERERRDNRVENLRWATKAEQSANRKKCCTRRMDRKNVYKERVDEEFRMISGILVSQYGATKNRYGVSYLPLPNKSMEYALVGTERRTLHRLVALAFPEIVGTPGVGQTTVDHINRDKSDNRAVNLRWATHTEQQLNTSRRSPDDLTNNDMIAVEAKPPDGEWVVYQSCSQASREIKRVHGRHIAAQSIAQLVKKHPEGKTIKLRQNAGWSFRLAL